jgi:hypothetical protein
MTEETGGAPAPDRPHWWRLPVVLVASAVAIALLVALWATRPYGPLSLPPPPGGARVPTPAGTDDDARSSASAGAVNRADTSARPGSPAGAHRPSSPPPPAVPLTASYATVSGTGPLGLTGYRGQLTIANPGQVTVAGWTVTLNLPNGATVTAADGAEFSQQGRTVVFNPASASAEVPGHGSVRFTFDVASVLSDAPTDCTINTRPCG